MGKLDLAAVFKSVFPDYENHYKSTEKEDRAGTDYFVNCRSGMRKVDIKLMLKKSPWIGSRCDNLPVEYWSVKERGIRGLEGDADYVIWLYADTLRAVCAPRKQLRNYIDRHRLEWTYFLSKGESRTRLCSGYEYTSTFFWVPAWEIEKIGGGILKVA